MRPTPAFAARATTAILMALAAAGCATHHADSTTPISPGVISHPVFFTLVDPDDADELIRDCDDWLAPIPGIQTYACGRPYDSGRPQINGAYDVGLFIGFNTIDDYESYVTHPDHVRLIEKWRPRLRTVEIRDILDQPD